MANIVVCWPSNWSHMIWFDLISKPYRWKNNFYCLVCVLDELLPQSLKIILLHKEFRMKIINFVCDIHFFIHYLVHFKKCNGVLSIDVEYVPIIFHAFGSLNIAWEKNIWFGPLSFIWIGCKMGVKTMISVDSTSSHCLWSFH